MQARRRFEGVQIGTLRDARDRNQVRAMGSEPSVQNEVSGIVDQYAVVGSQQGARDQIEGMRCAEGDDNAARRGGR